MKTNLFCITSHCDNNEKLELLKQNITTLKQNGFRVLVSSHIPLDEEILKSIDYFIYDESNPILHYPERALKFWKTVWVPEMVNGLDGAFWELRSYIPDYGWTVLNQYSKMSAFCKTLDYTNLTIINYDVKLTPKMLGDSTSNIMSTVMWKDGNVRFPSLIYFTLNSNDFFRLTELFNKQDYIDNKYDSETYLGVLLKDFKYEVFEDLVEDEVEFKEIEDEYIWNVNNINDEFELFYDYDYIIIYTIKNKVIFNIDGEDISLTKPKIVDIGSKIGFYNSNNELININHLLSTKKFHSRIMKQKHRFDIKTQKHTYE
tara:strand:- start:1660 stop:2607 length:948 start_codon:yes stop_codon:yes gene_type:complete